MSIDELFEQISQSVERLARTGYRGFDCEPEHLTIIAGWGRPPRPASSSPFQTLDEVIETLKGCQRCRLSQKRNTVVFGEGNPNARLIFIGEGPGAEEDRQGRPFVGAAGQLLDKIITAMGLKREEVYIANVVKCRPPGNRDPRPDEIETCLPFLKAQLALINPEYIVSLGRHATQAMLETSTPISRLRGRFFDYGTAKLMPTFHPAYLLHNPNKKAEVWADIQKVMKEMGLR
jgi:DNA polymerase